MTLPVLVGETAAAIAVQGGRFGKIASLIRGGAIARFIANIGIFEAVHYGLEKLFNALGGSEGIIDIPGVMPLCERDTEKMFHEHFRKLKTALGEQGAMSLVVLARMLATCPPGVAKVDSDSFINQIIVAVDAQVAHSWSMTGHGEGSSFSEYIDTLQEVLGKTEGPRLQKPNNVGPNNSQKDVTPYNKVKAILEREVSHDPAKVKELRTNESSLKTLWDSLVENLPNFLNTAVSAQTNQEIKLTQAGLLPFEAIEYSKFLERLGLGKPEGISEPTPIRTPEGTFQIVRLQPTNILNLLLGVYGPQSPSQFSWKSDTAKHLATAAHAYLAANDGLSTDLGIVLKGQTHKTGTKEVKLLVNNSFGFSNDKHHAYVKTGVLTSARRDEVYAAFKARLMDVQTGRAKSPSVSDINGGRPL